MKAKFLFILSLPMFSLMACTPTESTSSSVNTDVEKHTVTFHLYDDKTFTSLVEHNQPVAKPDTPTRENYEFAGWFLSDSEEDTEAYDFSTLVVEDFDLYAHWIDESITTEVLQAALDYDYSNSTVYGYESGGPYGYFVYNYEGFNIAENIDASTGQGDGNYSFYCDYEGESHQFWSDDTLGDAWIRQGPRISEEMYVNYGIESNYFTPMYTFPKINAKDFEYINGAFHLADPDKIDALLATGAFQHIWDNNIADIAILLDSTKTMISKIYTFDSLDPNDEAYTEIEIGLVGETNFIFAELPVKPNQDNVKTYYEWKGEDIPEYVYVESIELDYADSEITSIYVDKSLELKYKLNPENVNRKDLEFLYEGTQDGITINYSFTANQIVVKGVTLGTYTIKVHDKMKDVYSNPITVTVLDTPASIFTNCLYDLGIEYDSKNNPVLYNYMGNGKEATYQGSEKCFEVGAIDNGENPKLTALTNAMTLEVNGQGSMGATGNSVYVDFTLSEEINAMSFTYGCKFENHASYAKNVNDYTALIYTSVDGVDYVLASDWTNELSENVSAKGLARKDIKFDSNVKYVRIAFNNSFIGHTFDFVMDTWSFYLEP